MKYIAWTSDANPILLFVLNDQLTENGKSSYEDTNTWVLFTGPGYWAALTYR
jgi:hypothetical protein